MDYVANIERVLTLATDDEIADGLVAYRMQHGIARVLTGAYRLASIDHAAGIIAALSPLNNWDDNVSDAFAVCRCTNGDKPVVRTTHINLRKALEIRHGQHPLDVLKGRKVTAFYLLTADPERTDLVPVDRHLAAAAVGRAMSDHETIALLRTRYDEIEQAFLEAGNRHGVHGHQIGSVVWYAWRRMKAAGTLGQRLLT